MPKADAKGERARVSQADAMDKQTIVVINDEREVRTLIELALARAGRSIVAFGDGQQAIDFLGGSESAVDLVVSDVAMEGFDAHRLLRHLRASQATAVTPVIFLTPHDVDDEREPADIEGLVERLATPFEVAALRERADALLARPRQAATMRDPETGFHTRERFEAVLAAALEDAPPDTSVAVSVALIDGDDRDGTIARVARVVSSHLRAGDSAGRLTQHSFATLHPRCGAQGAAAIATRILEAVKTDAGCARITLSLGVAVAGEPRTADPGDLIEAARSAAGTSPDQDRPSIVVRTLEGSAG